MNIYTSGFLNLEYDPATDIMSVSFPPVSDILVPEISSSFGIIVEHVRNYDSKKLLFDARDTQVDVGEEVFAPVIAHFVKSLTSTRVQKIARIISSSHFREHVVRKVFKGNKLPIQFQSFTEVAPAISWLNRLDLGLQSNG
ncbi:hypothetical protein [Rufibacter latericius]|uniref:STAS/SEC14 domain-containing protein n=1 Tax=Rufibacter latericius TaxID=2487040 RepID=A0A3M9MGT0_9BACT|nr:hypothetical protein [Rufibacter latericius]RNI24083.1 hypothetical protein EFB08_17060 [Rufibacter latericius]